MFPIPFCSQYLTVTGQSGRIAGAQSCSSTISPRLNVIARFRLNLLAIRGGPRRARRRLPYDTELSDYRRMATVTPFHQHNTEHAAREKPHCIKGRASGRRRGPHGNTFKVSQQTLSWADAGLASSHAPQPGRRHCTVRGGPASGGDGQGQQRVDGDCR